MGNELTQYQKDLIRMWDSLRTDCKGAKTCEGIRQCGKCPFTDTICSNSDEGASFNAEKAIKVVTQWAKEHPIITMKDKYKETFGVEPIGADRNPSWYNGELRRFEGFLCPKAAGFDVDSCPVPTICPDCSTCKEKFWNSEYKKREVVQNDTQQ